MVAYPACCAPVRKNGKSFSGNPTLCGIVRVVIESVHTGATGEQSDIGSKSDFGFPVSAETRTGWNFAQRQEIWKCHTEGSHNEGLPCISGASRSHSDQWLSLLAKSLGIAGRSWRGRHRRSSTGNGKGCLRCCESSNTASLDAAGLRISGRPSMLRRKRHPRGAR